MSTGFACTVCSKELSSRSSLQTHQLVHFREVQKLKELKSKNSIVSQCPECERCYATEASLARHRLVVHSGKLKKLACEDCGKEFNFRTALRLHIINHHTKEKPFACQYCDKSFGISGNLRNHIRTHTGETHNCRYCDVSFRNSTQLTRHISVVHVYELDSPIVKNEKITPKPKRQKRRKSMKMTSPQPPAPVLPVESVKVDVSLVQPFELDTAIIKTEKVKSKRQKRRKRKSTKKVKRRPAPIPPLEEVKTDINANTPELNTETNVVNSVKKPRSRPRPRKTFEQELHDQTESSVLPERSSRNRKPPMRYSQPITPIFKKYKLTKYSKRNSLPNLDPSVDYNKAIIAKTDGLIPEVSKYDYDPIEVDISQLYSENDRVDDDSDEMSPIILNTYSLADNIGELNDEAENSSSSYNSTYAPFVSPHPSIGEAKLIFRYRSGLILEGIQCPRF